MVVSRRLPSWISSSSRRLRTCLQIPSPSKLIVSGEAVNILARGSILWATRRYPRHADNGTDFWLSSTVKVSCCLLSLDLMVLYGQLFANRVRRGCCFCRCGARFAERFCDRDVVGTFRRRLGNPCFSFVDLALQLSNIDCLKFPHAFIGEPLHLISLKHLRKAVECFFAEIAQLPDGTYYVSLTATTIDEEEPQLLNMEIEHRRGITIDEVLAVIRSGLTGPT